MKRTEAQERAMAILVEWGEISRGQGVQLSTARALHRRGDAVLTETETGWTLRLPATEDTDDTEIVDEHAPDANDWTVACKEGAHRSVARSDDWSGTWEEAKELARELMFVHPKITAVPVPTRRAELMGKVPTDEIAVVTIDGVPHEIIEGGSMTFAFSDAPKRDGHRAPSLILALSKIKRRIEMGTYVLSSDPDARVRVLEAYPDGTVLVRRPYHWTGIVPASELIPLEVWEDEPITLYVDEDGKAACDLTVARKDVPLIQKYLLSEGFEVYTDSEIR